MRYERRSSFANASSLNEARAATAVEELRDASSSLGGLPPSREDASPGTFRDYVNSLAELLRSSPMSHKWFVGLVLLQIVLTLVERLWLFSASGPGQLPSPLFREALWLLLVISVTALYVGYFALSSMLYVNYVEMLAYFATSLILLGRLAGEAADRSDECSQQFVACYVLLGLISLCVLCSMLLSLSMMEELRVKRFKVLGAKPEAQRVYFLYELFATVRTLDFQFSIANLLTGLIFFSSASAGPYALAALVANVLVFIAEVCWNWLGREGIRRERAKLLWGFWALSPLAPALLIAVAVDTAQGGRLLAEVSGMPLRITIYVLALLTLVCRAATVALSCALFRLFGPAYVQLRGVIESDRSVVFLRKKARYASSSGAAGGAGGGAVEVLNPSSSPAAAAAAAAAAAPSSSAAGAAPAVAEWARAKQQRQPHV
jgi:hypothetical protein